MAIFSERHLAPEIMDQPGLDPSRHRTALRGLSRVNRISGTAATLWSRIRTVRPIDPESRLRVLDLACGGGDVLLDLAERSVGHSVPIDLFGRDISETAIVHAREAATRRRHENIEFSQADALLGEFADGPFDVVFCTLFLHHLNRDDATILLRRMGALSRRRVFIDDLRRTGLGYLFAWVGCRLLSRSPIVHADGPASARAAFTEAEVMHMAEDAGLQGATMTRHWPQRFLFDWRRT